MARECIALQHDALPQMWQQKEPQHQQLKVGGLGVVPKRCGGFQGRGVGRGMFEFPS